MARDPQVERHQRWLGYLQPEGLVVAPVALVECQAFLRDDVLAEQKQLDGLLARSKDDDGREVVTMPSIHALCVDFLGWQVSDLVLANEAGIEAPLPEYHESLRPTFAVRNPMAANADAKGATNSWLLLIQNVPCGVDFDKNAELADTRHWQASWHARFERLLRESGVPIGLLFNGTQLRLVYAPKGESSGHMTFDFAAMREVGGRPILAGLLLLLQAERLFSGPISARLPALFETSRKFQNRVSTQLAQQVLEALHELLRGFQAADAASTGSLLAAWLRERPDDIYGGLLTTILRLIFLLYAEDRRLLGSQQGGDVFASGYSIQGLFERLREDQDRNPDTMDQRYGAWAQLLALFRLVHDGGSHGALRLPARHGYLFDPDGGDGNCYQFLEGRPLGGARQVGARLKPPRIADGVIWRVLSKLMLLDGERISYRTLDVEQIGSVYETMMGFRLEMTRGPSLAIKPQKPHGAPAVIDLGELLAQPGAKRAAWLKEKADCKPTDKAAALLKEATAPEEVHAALGKRVSELTPQIVPAGTMVLQPSDERRRSGSHYTPPSLTQPIVQTTLRPILEQLGDSPKPEQILALKVCDPTMGSGAFLVEACRQIGKALVASWHRHKCLPKVPPDEDEEIHARRLVARSCLYGVDKNPFAVALAKLSLWLVTFAKDHPFTFVDHALRCGDSLVGLSKAQIRAFGLDAKATDAVAEKSIRALVERQLEQVANLRAEMHAAGEGANEEALRELLDDADRALADVRLIGDLAVRAFFAGDSDRKRKEQRERLMELVQAWLDAGESASASRMRDDLRHEVDEIRAGEKGVPPFHWEVEYPEVFARDGFDAVVGNPPFLGGRRIRGLLGDRICDWLMSLFEGLSLNADLVASFFRRSFGLLRQGGCFGLVATNTIAQGDTRRSGLTWIAGHGGQLFNAIRRVKWSGDAAVMVSVVCAIRGRRDQTFLDGRLCPRISAYLFHGGADEDPATLQQNANRSYQGVVLAGSGFLFDDTNDGASSVNTMHALIEANPCNQERIFPYIGGEEFNDDSTQAPSRWVISFDDMSEAAARNWPDLMAVLEEKVRPYRITVNRDAHRKYWWHFGDKRPELMETQHRMVRVLANAQVSAHCAFAFQPTDRIFAMMLNVFTLDTYSAFCSLQSRPHETWARFFGSSMKDDLRYTPTDCFETFPFPPKFDTNPRLEAVGKAYYEFRAAMMIRHDEGLTKTYNHFHTPPSEPTTLNADQLRDIEKLRALHADMDRAVLDAYGWTDLKPTHEFLLDYEDEQDDDAEESGRTRRRKKPYRYRWPDELRDEVLMRLLRLNEERAKEEALHTPPAKPSRTPKRRSKDAGPDAPAPPGLFG